MWEWVEGGGHELSLFLLNFQINLFEYGGSIRVYNVYVRKFNFFLILPFFYQFFLNFETRVIKLFQTYPHPFARSYPQRMEITDLNRADEFSIPFYALSTAP